VNNSGFGFHALWLVYEQKFWFCHIKKFSGTTYCQSNMEFIEENK
jgi:hypothetical protein